MKQWTWLHQTAALLLLLFYIFVGQPNLYIFPVLDRKWKIMSHWLRVSLEMFSNADTLFGVGSWLGMPFHEACFQEESLSIVCFKLYYWTCQHRIQYIMFIWKHQTSIQTMISCNYVFDSIMFFIKYHTYMYKTSIVFFLHNIGIELLCYYPYLIFRFYNF